MFLILLLNFANVGLQKAEVPMDVGGDNAIKEAIKVLQLNNMDNLMMEIADLKIENDKKDEDKLKFELKYTDSLALIEKMERSQKEEIKRINQANKKRNEEMSADHMKKENILKKKLKSKNVVVKYVLTVLRDSDKMIDFWQNTVQIQAEKINSNNKHIEQNNKYKKIAFESQETIRKQSSVIEQLELVILNNQNLTQAYQDLAKHDLTKNDCDVSSWITTLSEALSTQKKQIDDCSVLLEEKSDMKENIKTVENLISNIDMSESFDNSKLFTNYHQLMEKQSSSITLLRRMLTSKENSSCGLRYEEDDQGRMLSASTCECIPIPPPGSGLQLAEIKLGCKGKRNDNYTISCSEGRCRTETWPTCEPLAQETEELIAIHENITWEYHDCRKIEIPYLNRSVRCGKDGHKIGRTNILVGQGVFTHETPALPCIDCDEQLFQWTPWSRDGNKSIRTRGSSSFIDSFQEEERIGHLQCSKAYSTLTESWRQIRYGVKASEKHCDDGLIQGWYRFKFANNLYATIPTSPPPVIYTQTDMKSCGTHAVSYLPEPLPALGDPPKDVKILFAWESNSAFRQNEAKIVACEEDGITMYLYHLKATPDCTLAYCAI